MAHVSGTSTSSPTLMLALDDADEPRLSARGARHHARALPPAGRGVARPALTDQRHFDEQARSRSRCRRARWRSSVRTGARLRAEPSDRMRRAMVDHLSADDSTSSKARGLGRRDGRRLSANDAKPMAHIARRGSVTAAPLHRLHFLRPRLAHATRGSSCSTCSPIAGMPRERLRDSSTAIASCRARDIADAEGVAAVSRISGPARSSTSRPESLDRSIEAPRAFLTKTSPYLRAAGRRARHLAGADAATRDPSASCTSRPTSLRTSAATACSPRTPYRHSPTPHRRRRRSTSCRTSTPSALPTLRHQLLRTTTGLPVPREADPAYAPDALTAVRSRSTATAATSATAYVEVHSKASSAGAAQGPASAKSTTWRATAQPISSSSIASVRCSTKCAPPARTRDARQATAATPLSELRRRSSRP